LNLFISTIKYGWGECFGGGGRHQVNKFSWEHTYCRIGESNYWGINTYSPSDQATAEEIVDELANLLTSGRLTEHNRDVLLEAYSYTMAQGKGSYEAMINVQQLLTATPEFQSNNSPIFTGLPRTLPSSPPASGNSYKAIIYVMLSGGADSYSMLVPDVCTGTNSANMTVDQQYLMHRGAMAFDRASGEFDITITATGQPCSQFALHDELDFVKELYDANDMLWVANSGVVNRNGMTASDFNQKTKVRSSLGSLFTPL
jgi:hypothetical protein